MVIYRLILGIALIGISLPCGAVEPFHVDWKIINGGTEQDLLGVHFADPETGWAVGDFGTILTTRDGGAHWSPQKSGTEWDLNGVYFADPETGWAVGDHGTILATRDGGANWSPQKSGTEQYLYGVYFADPDTGWAIGEDGTILATRDGGATWSPRKSGTEQHLYGVYFAGPDTGWAVGEDGTILATPNGGANWSPQKSGTEQKLWSVHFADPETGWVVGDFGTILATRDGGATWTPQKSGTKQNLDGVYFADPETGWAVGDFGTILATRDGGANWSPQRSGTEQDLWGVYFAGPETGAIVGKAFTILRSTGPNYAPTVASLHLEQTLVGSIRVSVQLDDKEHDKSSISSIWFRTDEKGIYEATGWRLIPIPIRQEENGRWIVTWDPAKPRFGVGYGNVIYFKLQLNDGGGPVARVWTQGFTYQPLWFVIWREHRAGVLGAGSVIAIFLLYASGLAMVLWLRPVSLAHLGGSAALDEVADATGRQHWLEPLVRIGTRLVFNPWITTQRRVRTEWIKAYQKKTERFGDLGPSVRTNFLDHPDVLDAWVERQAGAVQAALEHFDLYRQRRLYVALPVRMGDSETGRLVEQPSPQAFRPLFDRERVVLPIVGVGGSGKSTLACALARWALAEPPDQRLAAWRMLPVIVAEETQDLLGSINRKLTALAGGDEIEADILKALLRTKRLLVIVDALSERTPTTQAHVSEFYGSRVPLNALVLTTRREPKFGQLDRTPIYTERLTGPTLIPFIFEYLRRRQLEGAFNEREQLKLSDRVLALVQAGGRVLNVTPLLVTMFVESALARSRQNQSLEQLPASVPEVYLDYLRRLNPKAPDGFDDTTVIKAARTLGTMSLGASFVPGDVRREAAEKALETAGFAEKAAPVVDRLVANGVLEVREIGGATFLRFALDPVAEHLAAIDMVHQCGSDPAAWSKLFTRLKQIEGYPERISGFLGALGDCYVTYRTPFELPELKLPWQAHEASRDAA